MKNQPQFQKIIAILMTFIIIIEFTGCYTIRVIPTSEIPVSDKYLIHDKKSTFCIYETSISSGILAGKIDFNMKNCQDSVYTHLYVSSFSQLKINNHNLSLPVDSIVKIEQKIPDPQKTRALKIVLVIAGIAAVTTAVFAAVLASVVNDTVDTVDTTIDFCNSDEMSEFCGTTEPY